jgi:hypothetical protein
MLVVFTASLASADLVTVTTITTNTSAAGWRKGSYGSKAGANISAINAYGNPGPAPLGSVGMQTNQTYGSNNEGQAWVGIDDYAGVRLDQITSLEYWTWVQRRGEEGQYCVEPECTGTNQKFGPSFFPGQPPQINLIISKDGTNLRDLIYRPWGWKGDKGGGQCRKWQEWNCMLDDGVWYVPEWGANTGASFSWNGLLDLYPNATIAGQYNATTNPYGVQTGRSYRQSLAGAGFNLQLGARYTNNNDFDRPDGFAWWKESYNARTAFDLVTVGVNDAETTWDFQTGDVYATRGVSNLGLTDATYNYCKFDPPNSSGYGLWETATQRNARYNRTKFVIWGTVCTDPAVSGSTFYVDDGAGKKIRCYSSFHMLMGGELVRMAGWCAAPNPWDWGLEYEYPCDCGNTTPGYNCGTSPDHWFNPPFTMVFNTFDWDITVL